MITAEAGVPTPLEIMLFDGATGKGVKVWVRTTTGVLDATVVLAHIGEGLYTGLWTPAVNGYYHANYIVYTSPTLTTQDMKYNRVSEPYYVTTPLTPESVAEKVWDAMLIDHSDPGSFGEAISLILAQTDPHAIGGAVWDEFQADHVIPYTFGDYFRAIWDYCRTITEEVVHAVWGLHALYDEMNTWGGTLNGNILLNGTKIDALVPVIHASEVNILAAVTHNTSLLNQMEIQDAEDLASIMTQFGITNNKIDAVGSLVGTLQNNTTVRFIVPERLVKPTSGTKNYQFHLRLYDDAGNPEAPDLAPTIRVRRLDTGVDIVSGASMTQDGAKVGAYYYIFPVTAGTSEYPALVEATLTENGVVRYIPSVTEVTEFEADLNAIQAQLSTVDAKVTTTNSQLTNPSYGLPALKIGINDILAAIAAEGVVLGQVKAQTDLIPPDTATVDDINDILMQLAEKPTIDDIQTRLNLTANSIKGPDGRTITDVYDRWDITTLAKTADPRFSYLDAPISSRSVLNAASVWGYANRTLTDFTLDQNSIKNIWSFLASQANVPGSIGNIIANYLDASVSSRATALEVETLLSGVAQEDTLTGFITTTQNSFTTQGSKLDNITGKVMAIQAKTNLIPPDPARQSTLEVGIVQVREDLVDQNLVLGQIKAKTDNLPVDPARETSVQARPTNPVLVTDARLANLDARISTRSTLSTADLANLATHADVHTSEGNIIAAIEDQDMLLHSLMSVAVSIKSKTDRIPVDPATLGALYSAEAAILDAIAAITGGGSTAADIWSYPTRTITQDPASFGPDISNLATKADVAAIGEAPVHYKNRMTTAYNPGSGMQEVLAWAEKNGERVVATSSCNIAIKDSLGVTKWFQFSSVPNADGVYRFVNPVVVTSDANYYIIISIIVDGVARVTQQAFITIG